MISTIHDSLIAGLEAELTTYMRSKHQKGAENPSAFLCTVPDFLRLFPPNLHNLFFFYDFTVSPDSLQIVEQAVLLIKDVDDNIAVVH